MDVQSANVVHKTGCYMALLVGDCGAFCHLCTITHSDAIDMDIIMQGFVIDKYYESYLASKHGKHFKMVKLHAATERGKGNVMTRS